MPVILLAFLITLRGFDTTGVPKKVSAFDEHYRTKVFCLIFTFVCFEKA